MTAENALTPAQRDDLRVVSAMMIPASAEYDVPGADDDIIQADILATLGRDSKRVGEALDHLARLAGTPLAQLDQARRDAVAKEFRSNRRRGGGDTYPRGAAVLLPRRSRAAFARAGAAAAIPEGPCAGAGRLVAAGAGEGASVDVAQGPMNNLHSVRCKFLYEFVP